MRSSSRTVSSCCCEGGGSVWCREVSGEGGRSVSDEGATWSTSLFSVALLPPPPGQSWLRTGPVVGLTPLEQQLSLTWPLSPLHCRGGPLHRPEVKERKISLSVSLSPTPSSLPPSLSPLLSIHSLLPQ